MTYDIIFISGEAFFDHPLSGIAILKRWLEKHGYSIGIIEMPYSESDILKLGKPRLFFGLSSGSMDSMLRNYNALKRLRIDDPHDDGVNGYVPDRAIIVYSNWVRKNFKDTIIVLGGTEATLRRFTHYDYWDNKLRKPILVDSRADILSYGNSEKQILEIAQRIEAGYKENKNILDIRTMLNNILGTCVISKDIPELSGKEKFIQLPSHQEVSESKEKFCDMQNLFSNYVNLAQKVDNRYILQDKSPKYESKDLDEYYELGFTREIPNNIRHLRGFEFSVVTHRGCIGRCNFCSLNLTQGDKIISRSEESILREIANMTTLGYFTGNIDDLGGPAANMYGMDCGKCEGICIDCKQLPRDNQRLIGLMKRAREIPGIENIYVRSGVRFDLCTEEYLKELVIHHTANTLRIAPEHVNVEILKLMNKNYGDLQKFFKSFEIINNGLPQKDKKELSFYFMTAHPGSTMRHAAELAKFISQVKNAETVQIFTPTPMTVSTCMYYTELDPRTKKRIYVPYAYTEKKDQKRLITENFGKGADQSYTDSRKDAHKHRHP
ncbi:MAG: YgiQ family radical SAM protein [Candidatus Woesearchaeota archaeon]